MWAWRKRDGDDRDDPSADQVGRGSEPQEVQGRRADRDDDARLVVASSAPVESDTSAEVPVVVADGGHRLPDVGPGHPRHRRASPAGLFTDLVAQPGAHLLDLGLGARDQQQALVAAATARSSRSSRISKFATEVTGSASVAVASRPRLDRGGIRADGSSPRSGAGSWVCSTLSASLARACHSRASGSVSSCTSRKSRRRAEACSCHAACMRRGTLSSSIVRVAGGSSLSVTAPPGLSVAATDASARSSNQTTLPCPGGTPPRRRRCRRAAAGLGRCPPGACSRAGTGGAGCRRSPPRADPSVEHDPQVDGGARVHKSVGDHLTDRQLGGVEQVGGAVASEGLPDERPCASRARGACGQRLDELEVSWVTLLPFWSRLPRPDSHSSGPSHRLRAPVAAAYARTVLLRPDPRRRSHARGDPVLRLTSWRSAA